MIPITFVAGAAAGAVTTYILKDDTAKQWSKDTGSKIKNSIKSGASSVVGIFKKKPKEDVVETKEGDVIDATAKDVTDKEKTAT